MMKRNIYADWAIIGDRNYVNGLTQIIQIFASLPVNASNLDVEFRSFLQVSGEVLFSLSKEELRHNRGGRLAVTNFKFQLPEGSAFGAVVGIDAEKKIAQVGDVDRSRNIVELELSEEEARYRLARDISWEENFEAIVETAQLYCQQVYECQFGHFSKGFFAGAERLDKKFFGGVDSPVLNRCTMNKVFEFQNKIFYRIGITDELDDPSFHLLFFCEKLSHDTRIKRKA